MRFGCKSDYKVSLYFDMRVAIVVNTSWNIHNFRMGLIQGLKEKGIEVIVIAPHDEYSERIQQHTPLYHIKMQQKGTNPFNDLLLLLDLYNLYKSIQPDCILHYTIKPNIYGTFAAQLAGIPSINNVSGLGTVFLHNDYVSKIAVRLYHLAFRFPSTVFFQNNDDRQLFLDRKIISQQNTGLLPGSGINLSRFTPKVFPPVKPFIFLFASRLLYDKGVVEFAEAAKMVRKKYPYAICLIAGTLDNNTKLGISRQLLDQWVRENDIVYKGFVENTHDLIAESHCIVLPSYREGAPRILIEAAAMARPCIASNVPGCTEVIIDEYNGFLCKPKDSNSLADNMEKMLLLSKNALQKLGDNGRALAEEKFNEQIIIEKYLQAIDRAVKK